MTKAQLRRLEANVSVLQKLLAGFGRSGELAEFIKNIRRPGWTTPAEFYMVNTIVNSMATHARALQGLQSSLLTGAKLVR